MQLSDLKLRLPWPRALQDDASLRHRLSHLKLKMNYDHVRKPKAVYVYILFGTQKQIL